MTPSNPSNGQPLIFRICDALGINHLVACFNHTHEQSEVANLQTDLAGKLAKLTSFTAGNFVKVKSDGTMEDSGKKASDFADAAATATALEGKQNTLTFDTTPTAGSNNPVTSGGVKTALNGKADQVHTHTVIGDSGATVAAGEGSVNIDAESMSIHIHNEGGGTEISITPNNAPNLFRALQTPDTTPTANSTKLVTSGGVKAAIDGKVSVRDTQVTFETLGNGYEIYLPNYFVQDQNQCSFIIDYQGDQVDIIEIFSTDISDKSNIRIISSNAENPIIQEGYLSVRIFRQPNGISQGVDAYYIIFDGLLPY